MSAKSEDMQKHLKVYVAIFISLLILTTLTVAVSYLNISVIGAVIIALVIATVKGALVACYFMHLISERKIIYLFLGIAVIFFAGLLLLPAGTILDSLEIVK